MECCKHENKYLIVLSEHKEDALHEWRRRDEVCVSVRVTEYVFTGAKWMLEGIQCTSENKASYSFWMMIIREHR